MTVNSREKGKRYERELANELKKYGFDTRRGQQYCGANGDADVVGLDAIHIEAKYCEQMRLYDWMEQAVRDAKQGELPAVFHRRSREKTLVTMRLQDWMTLYMLAYIGDEDRSDILNNRYIDKLRNDSKNSNGSIWKEEADE